MAASNVVLKEQPVLFEVRRHWQVRIWFRMWNLEYLVFADVVEFIAVSVAFIVNDHAAKAFIPVVTP